MPLAPLPQSTVKLIGSTQVITSVSSVIKELMENSIDSGAQHIEIKLDKHGFEKIEVKDDGCGIGKSDATVMCLPSYTSKISDFSGLDSLSSYGFRGEALSSLCNVAQVIVTTKTAEDDVATCYTYDHNGQVTCSKISHISKGTIVTVTDLFKNLPVRKQFVSSSKRASEELKRVEKVVKSLGMVHPRLRVTLVHNKFLIWQKTSVANLRQSVMQVVNLNIVKQLHHIIHSSDQIRVELLVPKRDCDVSSLCCSSSTDAYFLFINSRPVKNKEVEKAVYNKLFEFFGVYVPSNKYPVCVTCLTLPPECLDVNLEPNKTRVYLKNQDDVLDFVNQCLHLYYGEGKREEENLSSAKPPKKRKVEEEYPVEPKKINLEGDSIALEANHERLERKIMFFENANNLGDSQLCSNPITFSGDSMSKQESDSSEPMSFSGDSMSKHESHLSEPMACPGDSHLSEPMACPDEPASKQESDSSEPMSFSSDSVSKLESHLSEPMACLDKPASEEELDLTNKDFDVIFEEFCVKRDEESSNTVQTESMNVSNHQALCFDSKSSPFEIYSKFFPHECNEGPFNENVTSGIYNKHLNSLSEEDRNTKQQTDSEFNVREDKKASLKKMVDCLKKASEISSTVQKVNSIDAFLSNDNDSVSILDESVNFNEQYNNANRNGVVESKLCERKSELLTSNVQEPNLELRSPTLSQWSKGEILNPIGVQIQGPQLLTRKLEPESPSNSQEFTNRSVSSQMGCKEMSAFTKFARKMRKEILEEQPDLSFTKVAQILQVQWRHLDVEEKKKYEEIVKMKKSPIATISSKQKPISVFLSDNPNIELDITMEKIKRMVKEPITGAECEIRLVGQLEASPLWLYHRHGSGVFILSVTRVLEAVRYHKHLANFALPTKLLSDYITVTSSDLSATEWELLLSLDRSPNGVIQDERFTNNGFLIEIVEGETEARLMYVPQNIAYCGKEEVQEILDLLQTHGPDASLAKCRPLKVSSFIRSEVMRECSQEEPPSQPERVSDLVSYWLSCVSPHSQSCIHFRPVTQCLFTS